MKTKRYYTKTFVGIGFRCNDPCPILEGQMIGSWNCKKLCPFCETHGVERELGKAPDEYHDNNYIICTGGERIG